MILSILAKATALKLEILALATPFNESISLVEASVNSNCIVVPNCIPAETVVVVVVLPKSLLEFKTQKTVSDCDLILDKAVEFREIEFKLVFHDV